MNKFRIIILSGLSGSGKSNAIKYFEDMGFYCVDNLPTSIVPKFVELCSQSGKGYRGVALGMDIRERDLGGDLGMLRAELEKIGYRVEVLFLEASDEVLVRRFSETRRPHPLAGARPLIEAIREERQLMLGIREGADRILDTSGFTVHQLREELARRYQPRSGDEGLTLSVMSFGFKHGVPYDADLVFDVRFLPNPNFVPELKELTGLDKPVQDFVKGKEETALFIKKLSGLFDFLLPLYVREGKTYLTIAVGCTGGRHRSVAVAEMLKKKFQAKGLDILIRHRDKDK
ncbi:MAG TPA: RNase adapter RapZ [Nitrospirota bacterium]